MDLATFSSLVLAWQRLSLQAPPEGFHEAALTLLEPHLPFDSGWWGIANAQATQVSVMQGYLHRLPPEFIEDWWGIADVDALARRCAAQPGVTVLDNGLAAGSPAEEAFDARYDLSWALSTLLPDEDPLATASQSPPPEGVSRLGSGPASAESSGLFSFLSLFRSKSQPTFTEQERALVQLLVPHLIHAEQTHWRLGLRRQFAAADDHRAHVDEAGYLLQASTGFCQTLVREFPAWPGGPLPEPLQPLWQSRQGQWHGRQIEVGVEPLGAADDSAPPTACCRITVRARIGHGLTKREESIARAYAAGDSYKEIARELGLSPATVRGYLRDCYLKLGVSNKAALGGVFLRGAPAAAASAKR